MKSLITCVLVSLILLLTAGLIVGAVMRTRGAAAQADCRNNLKQLGLGLSMYRFDWDSFPGATFTDDQHLNSKSNLPVEKRLGWTVEIIPYLESSNLHGYPIKAWDEGENARLAILRPRFYVCKNNVARERNGFGLTSYVGIAGLGADAATWPGDHPRAGIFGYDRRTQTKEIVDGESTTLMAMETGWQNGPWVAGGFPTVRPVIHDDSRPCFGKESAFGGLHRRSTNVLFADGSVMSLINTIEPAVLEAMATIAGGQPVGMFEFE